MTPYELPDLPIAGIDWAEHVTLIGRANAALARYDGVLQSVVDPLILLSPLTTQEAVLSSRIEGTQASLEEVLGYEADPKEAIEPARRVDVQEIINCRQAMQQAEVELRTRPFSLNLLKDLHASLMDSVRGRDKSPGRFRRIQNYFAPQGHPIERAIFIPPVWEHVEPAMDSWEKYFHADERDPLVQLAVTKAYFELVHPFLDGNGRLGRMLIPLFLFEKGLPSRPMFYMSAYLERNQEVYFGRLLAISRENDWNGWIAFFLQGLIDQARENADKTRGIFDLYERMKREIPKITRSHFAIQVLDALFSRPIFGSTYFIERSEIPRDSALRILSALKKDAVIHELRPKRGRRGAVMMFPELLAITEGEP